MYHHVRAQLQRTLEIGGGEGVVADHLDVLVVPVGDVRHGSDIGDLQVGVGGRLQIDGAGVGLQRCPHRVQIGGVHKADLHAVAGHTVVQQSEGAAVQGIAGNDLVTGLNRTPQSNTGLAVFQRGDLGLQHGGGGIAQTGVDVAALLPGKAAPALLAAVKDEGGGLEDGGGQRAVLGVLHVPRMDGFRTETAILVQHGSSSSTYKYTYRFDLLVSCIYSNTDGGTNGSGEI